jgi:hypothetical protein
MVFIISAVSGKLRKNNTGEITFLAVRGIIIGVKREKSSPKVDKKTWSAEK